MDFLRLGLSVSTLLCALVAGLVLAFAIVVMPGIRHLNDHDYLQAFKVMDRVIQNNHPVFMVVWLGVRRRVDRDGGLGLVETGWLGSIDSYCRHSALCSRSSSADGNHQRPVEQRTAVPESGIRKRNGVVRTADPLRNTLDEMELDSYGHCDCHHRLADCLAAADLNWGSASSRGDWARVRISGI